MSKHAKATRRMQARTPSHKPMRRMIPPERITPGSAEGDLDTVEQDLKIQERRHPSSPS